MNALGVKVPRKKTGSGNPFLAQTFASTSNAGGPSATIREFEQSLPA